MMMPATSREDLGLKLILLARLYRREMDGVLRDYGLSDATALPLRYLARQDSRLRQGALADILDLEGPTLVRVLDQLAAAGLVDRVEDDEDRRAKLVGLTDRGRALNSDFQPVLKALRDRLFAGVSEADVEASLRLFSQIEGNLSTIQGESGDAEGDSDRDPEPEIPDRSAT